MRFNKKTYPFLSDFKLYLAEGFRGRVNYNAAIKEVRSIINPYLDSIKSNICYVSNTFIDDAISNREKIWPSPNDLHNFHDYDGTPFCYVNRGCVFIGVIGKFYCSINNKQNMTCLVRVSDEGRYVINQSNHPGLGEEWASIVKGIPHLITSFADLADTNVKVLLPKKKIKDFHCRYKSDFGFKIRLYTENWYTESVQGHPFVVRGHWRMQRYGKGLSKKKLIPIAPFMKQGYNVGAFKDQ